VKRREFCARAAAAALVATQGWPLFGKVGPGSGAGGTGVAYVAAVDRKRVIADATQYLAAPPVTITAMRSDRSPGGPHDFYSEGDYWWPDPKNPGGPYIRRDGESNPQNFVAHREAMIRMSVMVPALAVAWKLTGERRYAAKAREHAAAWFIDAGTKMNPNLQYAQAIQGVSTGRGTGIIDTIHLVEVTRALEAVRDSGVWGRGEYTAIQDWFRAYVQWMTTSKNGIEERDAKNNHGSCWVMQVAQFAAFTGDRENMRFCADRFREKLIPDQVAADGSLPLELARTKPYSYSLFNMDILSTICQILSTPPENLWSFTTADGRGMKRAIAFMAPFIANKSKWPKPPDVEYFDELPVRQPSLLFGGLAYDEPGWIALWKRLNPEPTVPEIVRNFPIRQPVLWV
jgi:hypothetical protein